MVTYKYSSPLGDILLKTTKQHFTSLKFVDKESPLLDKASTLPDLYAKQLDTYFKGEPIAFNWPIQIKGTDFQEKVWYAIKDLQYGQTTTYKMIAEQLGTKGYQAVGNAVGANPLPIIIPCHRVLGTHSLGGYHYGLLIKSFLLALEDSLPDTLNNYQFHTC